METLKPSRARVRPRSRWVQVGVLFAILGLTTPAVFRKTLAGDEPSAGERIFDPKRGIAQFGKVEVRVKESTVSFPARVNMTNGIIEYVVVTDYGKTHESLLTTEVRAIDLQAALLLLNARPTGTNAFNLPPGTVPAQSALRIKIAWTDRGRSVVLPLEDTIRISVDSDPPKSSPMSRGPWLFNGSTFSREGFVAHFEGSLISVIGDAGAIINNPRPDRDDDEIHVPSAEALPPVGTPVTLRIEVPRS